MGDAPEPGPGRRPRRREGLWTRQENDRTAVYDPETGALHILNPSAVAIWELCDGSTSAGEMAEAVAEITGMAPEQAREEIVGALEELGRLGLLEEQG